MITEALKQLRQHQHVSPSGVWVAQNRERLLRQMQNTVSTEPEEVAFSWSLRTVNDMVHIFFSPRILGAARGMMAILLVATMTVSGWIASVSASYNSLPGERLYPIKLAAEKTELLVASLIGSDQDRVSTLLKHASNRMVEYKNSTSQDQAAAAIHSLQNTMQSTSDSLAKADHSSPEKAVAIAQAVSDKTDEILAGLKEQHNLPDAKGKVGSAGAKNAGSTPLHREIIKIASQVEAAGVDAVEVLVEKTAQTSVPIDPTAIKATVEKKLEKIVTDFQQINKDAAEVAASSTATSSTAVAPIVVSPLSPPHELGTTSGTVDSTITSTIAAVPLAVIIQTTEQKVEAANKTAERGVAEAKTLIENNDLLGAIKKVQELSIVKSAAEDAVARVKDIHK